MTASPLHRNAAKEDATTAERDQLAREADLLPVTVVVPVKNEAANLRTCLETVRNFAHVICVDSSSTDGTPDIARACGAEVINFEWRGGFPKKRNWLLLNHTFNTDWVLFLDADERVTAAFAEELRSALQDHAISGYWIEYDNHFMGHPLRHGVPQRKLALFKVGAGLFERIDDQSWSSLDMEVHEHPEVSGETRRLKARIIHHDYKSLHHFVARHNEYSTWEARRYLALASSSAWAGLTRRQRAKYANITRWWFAPAYFFLTYIMRGGFLDGLPGLRYALFKSIYFFEIRLKILELKAQ